MHNITGTSGMDQESHIAQENHFGGSDNWANVNSYGQNTMSDYGNYGYLPPVTHGLPSESIGRLPLSQPHRPSHTQHQSHTQLPMLIMPSNATWPSMLTNPASYSAPPTTMTVPTTTTTAPPTNTKKPSPTQQPTPRRTLTDSDRRRMCQYHEDNPGKKQSEIGEMFGVERSTVSKVLRQKDKYLTPVERSVSPSKRANKGRFPDIERALQAWAKKAEQQGVDISDSEIFEKAHHFAHGLSSGPTPENVASRLSSSWLEKFKQKHKIGSGKLTRRASETNITKVPKASPSNASQPLSGISPASPTGHPSPLLTTRSDEDTKESRGGFYDFQSGGYKHANSQSTTSLSSAFTDTAASSFSGSALSPTGPFTFSPDSNVGSFLPADQRQMPGSNFQRPRSQTFPTLDLEYLNQPATTEPLTPKFQPSATAPSSALDSPDHEMNVPPFSLDTTMSPLHQLRHSSSNSSMTARSGANPGAMASTPLGSTPNSPTLEDARRGLDLALNFVHKSVSRYDENDFMMVIRFFESIGLRQHISMKTPGSSGQPMGGLSRIPESSEVEMTGMPSSASMKTER